jgi:hypothetical protein
MVVGLFRVRVTRSYVLARGPPLRSSRPIPGHPTRCSRSWNTSDYAEHTAPP